MAWRQDVSINFPVIVEHPGYLYPWRDWPEIIFKMPNEQDQDARRAVDYLFINLYLLCENSSSRPFRINVAPKYDLLPLSHAH